MKPSSRFLAAIAAAVSLYSMPTWAGDAVAIVENVEGKPTGVQLMDYLPAGREIRLGPGDALVIGYLQSCWRETITGGVIVIGMVRSDVTGGKVQRERVECDGGKLHLTADQAAKSGVVVFRSGIKPLTRNSSRGPAITIYGLSPIVHVGSAGNLAIERLDKAGERIELEISEQQLLRHRLYDLAADQHALQAGGTYRATMGKRHIIFRVDPHAVPGAAPIVGRLIAF